MLIHCLCIDCAVRALGRCYYAHAMNRTGQNRVADSFDSMSSIIGVEYSSVIHYDAIKIWMIWKVKICTCYAAKNEVITVLRQEYFENQSLQYAACILVRQIDRRTDRYTDLNL